MIWQYISIYYCRDDQALLRNSEDMLITEFGSMVELGRSYIFLFLRLAIRFMMTVMLYIRP